MPNSNRSMLGFSLLELLIALIVFSIGLLAIAGLQTVSKQANFEAVQRTTAAQVANGLLEDMRTNGNGIDTYVAAPLLGGGAIGAEPVPNCRDGNQCNAAQKAAHDLWFWEQVLDGNLETNGGIGAGGLVMPALCITGPVAGGAGVYTVTIAWRGTASITSNLADPCGAASGNYGAQNEFRRL
ncbi:MAG TPA: type IV pilus modification protein PilV, partial [Woeseiaceae bacterium]|nr:type IV pilus modification protein PilV [Woeseiaceae bacterium]